MLHTRQPRYLNELTDFYEPVRQLRSSSPEFCVVIDLELF